MLNHHFIAGIISKLVKKKENHQVIDIPIPISPQKSIVLPDNDVLNKTSSSSNRDPLLYRKLNMKQLQNENKKIKETIPNEGNKFVEHVLSCDKELKHYTGFPN